MVTNDELGAFWDAEVKPTLGEEFIGAFPYGVDWLRRRYIDDVRLSPEAMAEITAWVEAPR